MSFALQDAHDFVLNNPQFINNSRTTVRNPRRDPEKGERSCLRHFTFTECFERPEDLAKSHDTGSGT